MLSLRELRRVAVVIDELIASSRGGLRVDKIVQPDPSPSNAAAHRISLSVSARDRETGERSKHHWVLSCQTDWARLAELDEALPAPPAPPAFASFLRARIGSASLRRVRMVDQDRQLALGFEGRDGNFELLLSIFGRRSNLYLLDDSECVIRSLRPLDQTRQELVVGERWRSPERPPSDPGEDRWEGVANPEVLRAIERDYSDRESEQHETDLSRRLEVALRKERKLAERRLAKVEAELDEADEATRLQKHGELLKGVLGRIRPGDSEVRAQDYDSGEEVVIPLDPKKSAKQNLDATFKRYQKLIRRLTKAGGQVDEARRRCGELGGWQVELEKLAGVGLEAFAERPGVAALLARHAPAQKRKGPSPKQTDTAPVGRFKDIPRRLHPRRYETRDGLEVWVGRNDDANDFLTTKLARGNDLFFHLDGAPGSHVVLKVEKGSEPPDESILDACELAVHFSKAKRADRADVHIVPIKQVKKPKGAKAGLVWVTGGRSLHLRREESRLERLMASRKDDSD
jgi:predicted ribosome quality control (RQC) complex YloA/Tae2 family protein